MKVAFIAITKIAKSGKYEIAIFNPLSIQGDNVGEINFDLFFQENKEFDLFTSIEKLEVICHWISLTDTVEFDFQAGNFTVYNISEERKDYLIEYLQKNC